MLPIDSGNVEARDRGAAPGVFLTSSSGEKYSLLLVDFVCLREHRDFYRGWYFWFMVEGEGMGVT